MTTIEKIEQGVISLAEFTDEQVNLIKSLVKFSYIDGYTEGYKELEGNIYLALNAEKEALKEKQ